MKTLFYMVGRKEPTIHFITEMGSPIHFEPAVFLHCEGRRIVAVKTDSFLLSLKDGEEVWQYTLQVPNNDSDQESWAKSLDRSGCVVVVNVPYRIWKSILKRTACGFNHR